VSAPGTLNYTILVTNTGNPTDDRRRDRLVAGGATYASGDTNKDSILNVGEAWTYTASYLVTQADINAGTNLVNTATVTTDQTTAPVTSDPATTTITQKPSVSNHQDRRPGLRERARHAQLHDPRHQHRQYTDLTTVGVTDSFAAGRPTPAATRTRTASSTSAEAWTYHGQLPGHPGRHQRRHELVNRHRHDRPDHRAGHQ